MAEEIYPIENLVKGGVAQNEYTGNKGALIPSIMKEAEVDQIDYPNGNPFKATPTTSQPKSQPVSSSIWLLDIAQSHHFTVQLEGFQSYRTPHGSFSKFLPVKTIQLNQTSYENMNIPVSIFGDFPLLNKKRVSTIAITCYDEDTNIIERQLRAWERSCFPSNKYVAYLSDVARKLTYQGYDVKGKMTLGPINMYVIPSGNISVSRDYSANDAKLLSFTLVCVGDGSSCATGTPTSPGDTSSDGSNSEEMGGPPITNMEEVSNFVNTNVNNSSSGPQFIGNEAPMSQPTPKVVKPTTGTKPSYAGVPTTISKQDSAIGRMVGYGKMMAKTAAAFVVPGLRMTNNGRLVKSNMYPHYK